MGHNFGKMLKITAIVVGIIVSLLGVFAGIQTLNMFSGINTFGLEEVASIMGNIQMVGFMYLYGGPLLGWTVALLIFGFGILIEQTQNIQGKLSSIETSMIAKENAKQVKQLLGKENANS